jgi:hypothetical protein
MRAAVFFPSFFSRALCGGGIAKVCLEDRVKIFPIALPFDESKLYYRELKRKFVNNPWKTFF